MAGATPNRRCAPPTPKSSVASAPSNAPSPPPARAGRSFPRRDGGSLDQGEGARAALPIEGNPAKADSDVLAGSVGVVRRNLPVLVPSPIALALGPALLRL